MFGGAITVNNPLAEIVIKGNLFERNMGWVSGNAIYIRSTRVEETRICGGIIIEGNTFENNIGGTNHSGGAFTLLCTYLTDLNHEDYSFSSGLIPFSPTSFDPDA